MELSSSADTAIRLSIYSNDFLCNKIKAIKPDCIRDKFVLPIYFYDAVCIYVLYNLIPYITLYNFLLSYIRILLDVI